jgi:uncharacterized membrane-anchored protein YitT (DUF2179 family)
VRFNADLGYVVVLFAGALLITGAFVFSESFVLVLVLPLLLLVFVLAIVFDAISRSRDSDS